MGVVGGRAGGCLGDKIMPILTTPTRPRLWTNPTAISNSS
jgi:hypothetical protein